jgi:hypothetical protein
MTPLKTMKRHMNESDAAEFLDVRVRTLQDWRFKKTGPVYCKFGGAVRYPLAELERFADAARVQTAA